MTFNEFFHYVSILSPEAWQRVVWAGLAGAGLGLLWSISWQLGRIARTLKRIELDRLENR